MNIQYFEIQFYDIIGAEYAHFVVVLNSSRSMQASIMSKQIKLADCFRQSVLQLFEGDSPAIFLHFQSFLIALCSHPGRILVSHLGFRVEHIATYCNISPQSNSPPLIVLIQLV